MKAVEVIGGGIRNKGANMMLASVLLKIRTRYGDSLPIALPASSGGFSFLERMRFGVFQSYWSNQKNIKSRIIDYSINNLLSKKQRSEIGLILENEIGCVLDISGYLYADIFSKAKIQMNKDHFTRIKKSGGSVILLPQAFGPFENNLDFFKSFFESVDLLYVRDKSSLLSVTALGKQISIKTNIGYDFSNSEIISKGINNMHQYEGMVCLVPNKRMLDKRNDSGQYIKIMTSIINDIINKHHKNAYFLIFGGIEDEELAININEMVGTELPIICENDINRIRYLIHSSYAVIGSRYHALITALYSGIPSVSIGWSHKYKELYNDFELASYIVDIDKEFNTISGILDALFNETYRHKAQDAMKRNNEKITSSNNEMWAKIFEIIDRSCS